MISEQYLRHVYAYAVHEVHRTGRRQRVLVWPEVDGWRLAVEDANFVATDSWALERRGGAS